MAQVQYKIGLVDYLAVIDAERTLLTNQLSLAQTVSLQVGASIHLIKALGGGWEGICKTTLGGVERLRRFWALSGRRTLPGRS